MSSADDTPFLARWSRRKAASRAGQPVPADIEPPDADISAENIGATPRDGIAPESAATSRDAGRPLTEDDFKDVDFDALDYASDYSRFMQKGVPEPIRQRALQKLWASDVSFTAVDPFQDYAGDFTDAALAVPGGLLKSAYKVGQGFLTDEEAKVWDDLGKPEAEPPPLGASGGAATALADGGNFALRTLLPGYLVRLAEPGDAADLASVAGLALNGSFTRQHGQSFARALAQMASIETLSKALAEGLMLDVAIARDQQKIIGFCGGLDRDVTWHMVWPDHGRKGVGTALLRQVEARLARTKTPDDLAPNVLASRLSAPLLQRLGYTAITEQVVDTPSGVSATLVVMRLG